jgi:hypothetical protein
MTKFDIYLIEESKNIEITQELLNTVYTPGDVVTFCQQWMDENEYTTFTVNWIDEIMSWEASDARIVRDSATFRMGRYRPNNLHVYGLKVIMEREEETPPEEEP